MLTVNDIIHLIQYYYQHSSYETAKKEVDSFRLEGLRGECGEQTTQTAIVRVLTNMVPGHGYAQRSRQS